MLYYAFAKNLVIAVEETGLNTDLRQRLHPYQTTPTNSPLALIGLKGPRTGTGELSQKLSGNYKGCPWKIAWRPAAAGAPTHIVFEAPVFSYFLFIRILLLPFLKEQMARMGGFSCLGSAFRHKGKIYILSGNPGSGKTTLLLQALEQGADFIGDNELVVDHRRCFHSLFQDIELRYRTACRSVFWKKMGWRKRCKLRGAGLLAFLTRFHFSFNEVFLPAQLGIEQRENSGTEKFVFIHLHEKHGKEKMSAQPMFDRIEAYEENYRRLFHSPFFTPETFETTRARTLQFLSEASCWSVHQKTPLHELLELNS